jgi:hypothetical protein
MRKKKNEPKTLVNEILQFVPKFTIIICYFSCFSSSSFFSRVFESVVVVVFQSVFHSEKYANNIFYF